MVIVVAMVVVTMVVVMEATVVIVRYSGERSGKVFSSFLGDCYRVQPEIICPENLAVQNRNPYRRQLIGGPL